MNTVSKEAVIEFEERKSKFIGYIKPVYSVKDAEEFILQIKNMHPSATHNVPLYRVIDGGQEHLRYNDDGEPSGTAGKPMADIAIIQGVVNFSLVATRYFGGVKLGSGGLIRAYAKTAKLAIAEAVVTPPSTKERFRLRYSYDMTAKMNSFFSKFNVLVCEERFTDIVDVTIEIEQSLAGELSALYRVDVSPIAKT